VWLLWSKVNLLINLCRCMKTFLLDRPSQPLEASTFSSCFKLMLRFQDSLYFPFGLRMFLVLVE
jgi:hypothetical protein